MVVAIACTVIAFLGVLSAAFTETRREATAAPEVEALRKEYHL